MAQVHLRPVTAHNFAECIRLRVGEGQAGLVASNELSLAQARVGASLVPLAIYDAAARGFERPAVPMVGFTMYELTAGVGFIMRLMVGQEHQVMVGQEHQGRGYGRAAMGEVIRRLRLYPEVEMIATSHRRGNDAAGRLYGGLGFVPWDVAWAEGSDDEVYLHLAG